MDVDPMPKCKKVKGKGHERKEFKESAQRRN